MATRCEYRIIQVSLTCLFAGCLVWGTKSETPGHGSLEFFAWLIVPAAVPVGGTMFLDAIDARRGDPIRKSRRKGKWALAALAIGSMVVFAESPLRASPLYVGLAALQFALATFYSRALETEV